MAYDLRAQDREAAATPAAQPLDRPRGALVDLLPFRVRMVACAGGSAGAAEVVARFEEEAAAEAFIRSKVAHGNNAGFDSGRHWGQNAAGDQVCYWIETDQETTSVKSADRP
jgi:hypothetical protein